MFQTRISIVAIARVLLLAGLGLSAGQAGASGGFHNVNSNAILGGAIGGGAGAAVGSAVGGRNGAILGSAVGAAAGVAIANPRTRETYVVYDDDREHRHHDHGRHLGHYKRHHHEDD